jgi:hypothetical protein
MNESSDTRFEDEDVTCERCGEARVLIRGLAAHQRGVVCEVNWAQRKATRRGLVRTHIHVSRLRDLGIEVASVPEFKHGRRSAKNRKNVVYENWVQKWVNDAWGVVHDVTRSVGDTGAELAYPTLVFMLKASTRYNRRDSLAEMVMDRIVKVDRSLGEALAYVMLLSYEHKEDMGSHPGLVYLEHYFSEDLSRAATQRGECALCCGESVTLMARLRSNPLAKVCVGCCANARLKTIALEV